MASSKLSDSDKQRILELYRASEETTTSLAERYGVSTSTISRVLKQLLSPEDYSRLIRLKRSRRIDSPVEAKATEGAIGDKEPLDPAFPSAHPSQVEAAMAPSETVNPLECLELRPHPDTTSLEPVPPAPVTTPAPPHRLVTPARRRRTSAPKQSTAEATTLPPLVITPLSTSEVEPSDEETEADSVVAENAWSVSNDRPELPADDLEGDDYEEDDEDDEDVEEDDSPEGDWSAATALDRATGELEILPFAAASLERSFYLVIDRASELITCPLKDFTELGSIPIEEEQSPTLPVFENQRLARRFSRSQLNRVIKLPDGQLLKKTQPYLEAKGITRLLIEGQVYALQESTAPASSQNGEEVPAL